MRKTISIITFAWIALATLEPKFLEKFFIDINTSFNEVFVKVFPFLGEYFSFNSLVLLIFLATLITETHYQRGAMRLAGLGLKWFGFFEANQVFSLETRSQVGERVEVDDFVKHICYIEKRFNSWFLILLVMALILGPGIYLAVYSHRALYLVPFVLVAAFVLFSLLRGWFSAATSDGGATTVTTKKSSAVQMVEAFTSLHGGEFIHVSLSDLFSDREVYFHSSQVTGVVQVSKFPWGLLFLFLISAVGAYLVIRDDPGYATRAIIVPAALLLLVIILALRKRLLVKMTGAHYYSLGNRSSARELIGSAASKPASPLQPEPAPWPATVPQTDQPEPSDPPVPSPLSGK